MANIVFRVPSKQITYGYVEVSGTPEEFGIQSVADAEAIGITYSHYVNRYLEGEVEGIRQVTGEVPSTPKKAPGKPVEGVSGVRQVEPDAEAQALIEKGLGATVVEESEAPWTKPAEASKPKPWENGATPKVAKIDW